MTSHYEEYSAKIRELNMQSTNRFEHEISEDGLKEDWLVRRECLDICDGRHRDNCAHAGFLPFDPFLVPIGMESCQDSPCKIMEYIDAAMEKLLHHPSSANEQWQYAINAQIMFELLLGPKEYRFEFKWQAPYVVYLARLLDKLADTDSHLSQLKYEFDDDLRGYFNVPCKLPTDLKKLDCKKLATAIGAAAEKAAVELERADNRATIDWDLAGDIIFQCLAETFEEFGFESEAKDDDETAKPRFFLIPDLDPFGIYTTEILKCFNNLDRAFDLIKNPPSEPKEWTWSAVKKWVNYVRNFNKFFDDVHCSLGGILEYLSSDRIFPDEHNIFANGFLHLFSGSWRYKTYVRLDQKVDDVAEQLYPILNYVVEEPNLTPLTKAKILTLIRNEIGSARSDFMDKINGRIKELRGDTTPPDDPTRWDCVLDETLELEKNARQLQDAETQKNMFININHSLKNIIPAISSNLSKLERRLPSESEIISRLLKRARQGTAILSDYARAITCSYRKLGNGELWMTDVLRQNANLYARDVLFEALLYIIPNMFYRRFALYERESENYFPEEQDMNIAEESWHEINDHGERIKWINQNLFKLDWEDESIADMKIGDENSTKTYLFIFFNEIFLNAVKAISYVDKANRRLNVSFAPTDQGLSVNILNSANGSAKRGSGHGGKIIENFVDMFHIKDFSAGFSADGNYHEMHFTIPMFSTQTIQKDKK